MQTLISLEGEVHLLAFKMINDLLNPLSKFMPRE